MRALVRRLLERYRESAVWTPHEELPFTSQGYTVTRPGHPPQHLDASAVVWPVPFTIECDGIGDWTMSWTEVPDHSWIDAYSGQGEELEALDRVLEEQRERIRRIR